MKIIRKLFQPLYFNKKKLRDFTLNEILDFAVNNVPYYREFKGEKFKKIPFLDKEIIKREFDNLKSQDLSKRNWYYNTSGGSTGQPVRFIQDKIYLLHQRNITYNQQFAWAGYSFGEPLVYLWGSQRDIFKGSIGFTAKLKNFIKNVSFLNAFAMDDNTQREYISFINKKRPKLLFTYVQSIYQLTKFAEKNGLQLEHIPAIMTSAGTLYPFIEETLEKAYHTKVFNAYGSREVGSIACSKPGVDGLKVFTENNFIEIVDENGQPCPDGKEGEIVVTTLSNYSMPLIRYKIGDLGVLNNNKYGFPVLEKVTGRVTDVFINNEGTKIDGQYFAFLLYYMDWVKKFQFIQRAYDLIDIFIVPYHDIDKEDCKKIELGIKRVMGKACKVTFSFVEDIPPTKSGKFRYTISEVLGSNTSLVK